MVQYGKNDKDMNPESAQIIVDLFRSAHPRAAADIGQLIDAVIHGPGDDVPAPDQAAGHAGVSASPQAAQAAVEFVMAAMLMASR